MLSLAAQGDLQGSHGGPTTQGPSNHTSSGSSLSQVLKNVETNLNRRAFQGDYLETLLDNCISQKNWLV